MVTNSTPNIFVAGFLLTTSISRFFIFLVFQRNPQNRLYCTVSAINRLSRFICVPVNCPSGLAHPCNSNHGSTMSTQRKTVVTVSPGKYTILSRTVPRNSLIVSNWVVVIRRKSRFFVRNVFINSASLVRYFSNSDNFSPKTPTLAAFKLSFVWYWETSCNNVSVLVLYLSLSPVNVSIRERCTHIVTTAATAKAIAAIIIYFLMAGRLYKLNGCFPLSCLTSIGTCRHQQKSIRLFRPLTTQFE